MIPPHREKADEGLRFHRVMNALNRGEEGVETSKTKFLDHRIKTLKEEENLKLSWIFAIALALVLVVFGVSGAFADNGPHGGYTATTDACAGCHRAHTAIGPSLLKSATAYGLCMTCHGVTSGGAGTDVADGLWVTAGPSLNSPLKGGGFTNAKMNTSLGAGPATAAVTSKHAVNGMGGYAAGTIWGIGSNGSGAGTSLMLECHTCHNPHGKSGATNEATYRILRATPKNVTGLSGAALTVPDVTAKVYTVSDATGKYYGQNYPAASDTDADNGKIATLSSWCARCHTRIHAASGSPGPEVTASGDAIYAYRHRTDGSNVGNSVAGGAPACLTCHTVHGSLAAMGTYSASVPRPGTAEGGGQYLDSSLLRIDNRGVCQACHNK